MGKWFFRIGREGLVLLNKRMRWGKSFFCLLVIILITSQAGAKMNTLFATRMGKVNAETITGDVDEKVNVPIPIVLWNKGAKAARVLYFSVEVDINGSGIEKIDYLYAPDYDVKGRLRSLFDIYPITHKNHEMNTEEKTRTMNSLGDIYTKDVNGDGIDELILFRTLGDVEVYDRDKLLFKYTPEKRPRLFEYKTKRVFHAALDHHDEMFFVAYRTPYGSVRDFSADDRRFYNSTPNYRIVRVSPDGIKEITPTFLDNKEPKTFEAVAGLNKPGATGINELILVTTFEGKDGYYLSRHTMTGKAIDTPRKIYAEDFDPVYFSFRLVPQSNQIIANSGYAQRLYFFTPEKPLNWIKTVEMNLLPGGGERTGIIGQARINGIPAVMIDNDNTLFVIDANGKYHSSINSDSKSDKPVAFATIKPLSEDHGIKTIRTLDQRLDRLLVIQSRKPGIREVSLEELEKAGERFLSDSEWGFCKKRLIIEYDDFSQRSIKWYCEKNNISKPEINSLDDIKKKLPGYYEEKVKDAKDSYRISLKNRLFYQLERKGTENNPISDEGDDKNEKEFKKWLASIFIAPELVVSIHNLPNGTVTSEKLANYYFTYMDAGGMSDTQDHINIRASGDHGQAFMVLQKKVFDKNFKPAYYTIVW